MATTDKTVHRFSVTAGEVAELVKRGHVVEASYASTNPGIYLDLSTPEGRKQGEDLLRIRGVDPADTESNEVAS